MDSVVTPARTALALCLTIGLAAALLAAGPARAELQIDFDPMRPPVAVTAAAPAAAASDASPATASALPALKITRLARIGPTGPATLSALVDDTWVRSGDVVAGYRVTALRNESIDLVSVDPPVQRLTLHLNPVTVERSARTATLPVWPALALEKKP